MPAEIHSSNLFADFAYAQADPGGSISPVASAAEDERAVTYYVKVPLLGWDIRTSVFSAIVLFLVMAIGMVAKAFRDQTESGSVVPPFVKLLRPFLISPIAFSAFWTPMYIQQGGSGVSFTMALYAFQIGFMWEHVLEKNSQLIPRESKKILEQFRLRI